MSTYVQKMLDLFEARTLREQILIGLTLLAATWGLWFVAIGGVVLDTKTEVVSSIDQLSQDMQVQSEERQRLLGEDRPSQRVVMQAQQNKLREMVVAQQLELDELLGRFVPPSKVPALLEDVLDDFSGLKLIRLASQPAEPLLLKASAQSQDDGVEHQEALQPQVKIYRHPIRMELEGGYADVIDYLLTLEQADWRFTWRKLEYVVEDYPNAQILIELETMSREKEWLGV